MQRIMVITQGQINQTWTHVETCEDYLKLRQFSYFNAETSLETAVQLGYQIHGCVHEESN
jgi:hypothetical protein